LQLAQVVDDGLKRAGLQSVLSWLVDRLPAGKVVGQGAPCERSAGGSEHLSSGVFPLWRIQNHEREGGSDGGPFLVPDFSREWFMGLSA
jgi:hypothetical protein